MLSAAITQFKLGDDGLIRYQPDASNPLPGEAFAKVIKGEKILEPDIEVIDAAGHETGAVRGVLRDWVKNYIRAVLEPLAALEQTEGMAEPVAAICKKLHEALGIVPREEIEGHTAALVPEMRQALRAKQVRLGPVLVFLPALNKPAGVRLRGLLYALWNGKDLPPPLPHDGIVSVKVDESADRDFYRAIGYPIYGPRAIRIDMLDRVISAIYDGAKDGKFHAQHKMAEWLGCQIADLYDILTAMGHRKVSDPLDQKKEETQTEVVVEEKPPEQEVAAEEKPPEVKVKPELATFALKRGKAFQKQEPKPKRERKAGQLPEKAGKRPEKKPRADRKKERKPERLRMLSAEAKANPEDSPFAILGQLKKVGKDGA